MRAAGRRGAHVSCLAEQAKILVAEADENNLDLKVQNERWDRWNTVLSVRARLPRRRVVRSRVGVLEDVRGAAGGGRTARIMAMNALGNGLYAAKHHEDARRVRARGRVGYEASALGVSEETILAVQTNLATTTMRQKCSDGMKRPIDLRIATDLLRTF